MMTKSCSKCGEVKAYEMFSRDKSRKDGYSYVCKVCESDRRKTYYEANKDKIIEYNKAYYEANKEKIEESNKAYYEANKEKINKIKKAYRENNKDKIIEYTKAYYEANKDKIIEYNKAYYEANKEKRSEYTKAYYEANKERYLEQATRRRVAKRKAIPKFLKKCEVERKRLVSIYKLREVISLATGIEHHVDHMWPLSDGGPHWSGNLQIITAKENLTKGSSVCKVTKRNIKDSLRIARKEYENSSNGH